MDALLKQELKDDIALFAQKAQEFEDGALEKKAYKGFSGGFGSYAQRTLGANMLRLRMAGGRLTQMRMGFIAQCIQDYGIQRLKLTTCQTIQLHDLSTQAVVKIMTAAMDHDIVTRGGGGDYPRNVMASPLSGVEIGEYFDVLPAAEAAGDYLLTQLKQVHLPRKLKVGFSSSPANATHATFRDLGFAARADGTFDVWCAGGLGPNPKLGVQVGHGVPQGDVLYYLKAMLKTFSDHGNFEDRARSRTRYLQDTLGEEGLVSIFRENVTKAKAAGGLDLTLCPAAITKCGSGRIDHPRAIPQKQPGLYAVSYHPIGGVLSPAVLCALYEGTKHLPQVEWRVGPDGTLYCLSLTAQEAEGVLALTADGAETAVERSVACIGATVCQQGVRDSQAALAMIVAAARAAGFGDGVLPRIGISGCPSSCGAHQIGVLGLQGCVKLVDKVPLPAYNLLLGGDERQGQERLGVLSGVILERDLAPFFTQLGQMVQGAGTTFDLWYPQHRDELRALISTYTA